MPLWGRRGREGMEWRRGTLRGLQIEWEWNSGEPGRMAPGEKGIWPFGGGCVRWGGGQEEDVTRESGGKKGRGGRGASRKR